VRRFECDHCGWRGTDEDIDPPECLEGTSYGGYKCPSCGYFMGYDDVAEGSIYIVTEGTDSDYCILAAFSSFEAAERYRNRFTYKYDVYIEEYLLDDPANEYPPGKTLWKVTLWVNTGDVRRAEKADPTSAHRVNSHHTMPPSRFDEISNGPMFITHCFARDREHAVKIAGEQLARWKAEKRGA